MLQEKDHKVVGQKGVLIKLEPYMSETITSEGVIIPLFENGETDGGRPIAKIKSDDDYSTVGKVIQISEKAQELLDQEKMDIQVGDYITIARQHKHPSNEFLIKREVPVVEFEGYLLINPYMIQSKLSNYGQ